MTQQSKPFSSATAPSPKAGTGHGAQATTAAQANPDSYVEVTYRIGRDTIMVVAILNMGREHRVRQRWARRTRTTWLHADGPVVWEEEHDSLSRELAQWLDSIGLPLSVATMLPRPATGAAALAIAAAAQEVARA